jgi:sugar lactone lactonase YvrE
MHAALRLARLPSLVLGGFAWFAVQTAGAVQFQISDATEFSKIIDTNAVFATNATINSQIEGSVWIPNGQFLVFSDMGNNKLKRMDSTNNTLSDYFLPPLGAKYNGKSPEPTPVGAVRSAVAVHVASRRWLSFLR